MGMPLGKLFLYFLQFSRSRKFLLLEYILFVFKSVEAENMELIYEIYSIYPISGDMVKKIVI